MYILCFSVCVSMLPELCTDWLKRPPSCCSVGNGMERLSQYFLRLVTARVFNIPFLFAEAEALFRVTTRYSIRKYQKIHTTPIMVFTSTIDEQHKMVYPHVKSLS